MRKRLFQRSQWVVVVVVSLTLASHAQTVINTLAGGGPNSLAATSSSIGFPWAVAVDSAGNTYISDNYSNRVFKVDAAGTLTVFAGNSVAGYTGDGSTATNATLNSPKGIAFDAAGNLYIADSTSSAVRAINTNSSGSTSALGVNIPAGTIATVAGNGTNCNTGTCGDGGPAVGPTLTGPSGVFLDGGGNLYIADTGDHRIRKVSTAGTITTVAGNGLACSSATSSCGDGGSATSAQLSFPVSVFVDGNENIFIADSGNNKIREVTASSGKISTIAGNGTACSSPTAACGDGGAATIAQLNLTFFSAAFNTTHYYGGVFVDGSGNVYIADSSDNRVREVTGGNISTIAGTGNICVHSAPPQCGDTGAAASAQLTDPVGVVLNGSGDLLITDLSDNAVREVSSGTISTFAGEIRDQSYSGDGATPTDAELGQPPAIYSDAAGDIFIADTFNAVVRELNAATGALSTVVGNGTLCSVGPCGDGGLPAGGRLGYVSDVFVDGSKNIFLADFEPSTGPIPNGMAVIREIPAGGDLTTIAGKYGALGYTGDSGLATSATLGGPATTPTYAHSLVKGLGLFLDKNGTIYIADVLNHAIRVVNPSANAVTIAGVTIQPGAIATVAGDGTACSSSTSACGDGGLATGAQLNNPSGVTVDGSGNIYIADSSDNRVREVNAGTGVIQTVAGTGTACSGNSCGDAGPATSATLNFPVGVQVDGSGNLFIGDSKDAVVREVTASNGYIRTVAGNYSRGFSGDGGSATSAQLAGPQGVAFDPNGNLLISDALSWRVRKVMNVALASTSTALASSANPSVAGQQVTFTATVTSKTSGTPTGTVTFYDGSTALGAPAAVSGGAATLALSSLTAANHTITAVYSGDSTFDGSKSNAVAQVVTDFTEAATTLSPASITAGGTATSTITLTAVNGFNSAVALTCAVSPTPTEAPTCQFSSNSVTPTSGGATSTLTIMTTGPTAMLAPAATKRQMFYGVWLFLPAILLSTAGLSSEKRRRLLGGPFIALAIGGCLFLASCSSSSSHTGNSGTPSGQYTVTVTAAAGADSKPPLKLTLTVQ